MKKRVKYNFGGVIDNLFGSGNSDPMENYIAQKYAKRTSMPNFVESPDATLTDNSIRQARAMQESESNPWTQGLDFLGSMAMQYGMNMMSNGSTQNTTGGEAGSTEGFGGWMNNLFGMQSQKAAYGGTLKNLPVEVEGKEVGQLPNGAVLDFKGPSHEQGGIDAILPEGTTMFSKRIKIDGKTMAERKKSREKQTSKLEKLKNENSTDLLLKNALSRNKEVSDLENNFDLSLQESVAAMFDDTNLENTNNKIKLQKGTGIYGLTDEILPEDLRYGDLINKYANRMFSGNSPQNIEALSQPKSVDYITPEQTPTKTSTQNTTNTTGGWDWKETLTGAGMPTFGDALGMFGNLKQAYDPYFLTLENRAGGTPNVNAFENYGEDGLEVLQGTKDYVTGVRDKAVGDLNLARNASVKRNRNSARGINTQRALDIATDASLNRALTDTYANFASQMMGILSQEAQMENQQDGIVMQGEQQRDLADRQDRDAFFSNLARDTQAIGEGLTRTGKAANEIKARGTNENFLNMLFDYVEGDVMSGEISAVEGVKLIGDSDRKLETFEKAEGWKELGLDKKDWDKLTKKQKLRKLI